MATQRLQNVIIAIQAVAVKVVESIKFLELMMGGWMDGRTDGWLDEQMHG